jgi:hypothetical protein
LLQIQFHGMWCHATGLEFSGTLNEACPFILRGGGVQEEFDSFWTPWPQSQPRRPECSGPALPSRSELVVYVISFTLRTARTGPTLMLLWAAASRWRSQLSLIL